jgi:hypothetical protein
MTTRVLSGIAIAVVGVLLLCSGLTTTLIFGGGSAAAAACYTTGSAAPGASAARTPGGVDPIGTWSAEQVGNAAIIVTVGMRRGIPPRGWVIAVATAMQESNLINSWGGDQDSIGLFQQRPSQGWGTPQQLHDPAYAAGKFYDKLLTINGWQTMPLTEAAQKVQRSAYPDAYAKWEPDATALVSAVGSGNWLSIPENLERCPANCPEILSTDGNPVPDTPTATLSASASLDGPCAAGKAVLTRAAMWLTGWGGGPVPYLSSTDPTTWFQGYRRDCSGYASMALGLPGPGLDTAGLAAHSTPIQKADLRAGDLLINPGAEGDGHVVIFDRWTDAAMSSYLGYEQARDGGTHHRTIPYPYFGGYPMTPYRRP